ncbi:MAG: HAD hydrolase family protein [Bulleidia sp.]
MLEFQDPLSVICFGDMSNDNGMMTLPGASVCLCDGSDDTKALSDYMTGYDHDHDGPGNG